MTGMHEMTATTKGQLVDAIISVIGRKRFDVYGEDDLVAVHQVACLYAFRKTLSGSAVETVRQTYDHLERTGQYPFFADAEDHAQPTV